MKKHPELCSLRRYQAVTDEKARGITYTPKTLADFVAREIVHAAGTLPLDRPLRILDPAVGGGELLVSLLNHLDGDSGLTVEVHGFEIDINALELALDRLRRGFPGVSFHLRPESFLNFVQEQVADDLHGSLFSHARPRGYDLIIANPPYVRTQIIGTVRARNLAKRFGLTGRVDLYHAFILGMSRVLEPGGMAGIIVSNRFMTTRSGASIRRDLRQHVRHAWDLGDTKLFNASVLPAVLLLEHGNGGSRDPRAPDFSSIYQTDEPATGTARDPIAALRHQGVIEVGDGRRFRVRHGKLSTSGAPDGVWRISTSEVDRWLQAVDGRRWGLFRDIGKVRVGVKTCADKVFVRSDWRDMPDADRPELLKPLTTHRNARRFKPVRSGHVQRQVLYPHEVVAGHRRPVNLAHYPNSQSYLEAHRSVLESRRYVAQAGRKWYEIWVPQDPSAWPRPKLIFRDITEEPTFWIDLDGSVVNGDCYWLIPRNPAKTDLLWLAAAVGNSTFIERFYDLRFNNKLYAGRRRFMAQYVEEFPLPNPDSVIGKEIISKAKRTYECVPSTEADQLQNEMDAMVWEVLTGTRRFPESCD